MACMQGAELTVYGGKCLEVKALNSDANPKLSVGCNLAKIEAVISSNHVYQEGAQNQQAFFYVVNTWKAYLCSLVSLR